MKKRILLAACVLLLCLSGCGGRHETEVWRAVSPAYMDGGPALESESISVSGSLSELDAAVEAFNSSPSDARLLRALPEGVAVLGWDLQGSELRLEVSPEYASLTGYWRTVADCCAALTFCSVEGVGSVSIWSGETVLTAALDPNDLMLSDLSGSE